MAVINPYITLMEMPKKHLHFTNQYLAENLEQLCITKTCQALNIR